MQDKQMAPSLLNASVNEGALAPGTELVDFAAEHVAFSYDEGTPARPALQDVNFAMPAKTCVGIIGESGAGKSTLVQLLAGFATPKSGTFCVNGQVVHSLDDDTWRARVAYIPQHPHIFSASLRDNVAFYCPDASDICVWEALQAVGLAEFVRALPQGLDTRIGEGAHAISGGQAQRIALARAFVDTKRTVVVFDEPTAHLYVETELALKPAMKRLMHGRTVFFATHRLHWVADMDYVLLLEGGRVAAFGTPEQVVHDSTGAYARLAAKVNGTPAACEQGETTADTGVSSTQGGSDAYE